MISCYELRIGNYVLVDENLQEILIIANKTASTTSTDENNEQVGSEQSLEHI
jgi:hypothetical protein